MSRTILAGQLSDIHAALSRSLEPMTQAQLAGELGVSRTAISNLMRRALEDGVAELISVQHRNKGQNGTTPNLYASPALGSLPYLPYSSQTARMERALFLLARFPEGVTQARLDVLTGWGRSAVTTIMYALELAGKVCVRGGTARRPKQYTLPPTGTVTPREPLRRTPSPPNPHEALTGELGAARKLVVGLRDRSARGLAIAGNYRLSKAEELYAQLVEGDYL